MYKSTKIYRIYTDGKFRNFDEKMKALYEDRYMDYVLDNHWEIPSVKNLDKRVQKGELIYVDDYTRSDGTKVSGYYRRRLLGTVSSQSTCYPAPRLALTHHWSDGKKFEKLSFFDFFRILLCK